MQAAFGKLGAREIDVTYGSRDKRDIGISERRWCKAGRISDAVAARAQSPSTWLTGVCFLVDYSARDSPCAPA